MSLRDLAAAPGHTSRRGWGFPPAAAKPPLSGAIPLRLAGLRRSLPPLEFVPCQTSHLTQSTERKAQRYGYLLDVPDERQHFGHFGIWDLSSRERTQSRRQKESPCCRIGFRRDQGHFARPTVISVAKRRVRDSHLRRFFCRVLQPSQSGPVKPPPSSL